MTILRREVADAHGYDSLWQAMNIGYDLIVLIVKGRFWGVRHVLVSFLFYVLQFYLSISFGDQPEMTLDLIPNFKALSYFRKTMSQHLMRDLCPDRHRAFSSQLIDGDCRKAGLIAQPDHPCIAVCLFIMEY